MDREELSRFVEYVVIGGYLIVLIAIAAVFRRFNKNISDYFRSGCRGTWWLVGSSAFMTAFSAWTFTGAAGVAYQAGWSVMIIFLANSLGYLLNALFLAPWFRQLRAISPPEVVKLRFGVETQQFYAWINFVMQILYSSLHLYGLSIFSAAVFGLSVQAVIVGIGLVVLLYSSLGGSWAVMATDFIQSIILLPMTVLVAALCLRQLGGVGGLLRMIDTLGLSEPYRMINRPGQFEAGKFTLVWAAAMFFKNALGYNTLTASARYFSVKDGWEARKAALLALVMMTLGALIWFIPPMTARLLYAAEVDAVNIAKPAEAAYAIASMKLLPMGLTGLMVVAMFAATMSSMDSGLNRNAAIFTNDIYPALCRVLRRKPAAGRRLLRLGQLYTLVLGFIIIAVSYYFAARKGEGIFEAMLNIGAVIGVPLITPMFMALFIRRAPKWSAIFSVAVAAVPSAIGFFCKWNFQTKVFVNTLAGAGAFLLTVPLWSTATGAYRRQVRAFFHRMTTPVDFEREVGQANDLSQLKLVGGFCAAIGGFVCLLIALPNPLVGRLGILFVGGCILLIGALLISVGARGRRG